MIRGHGSGWEIVKVMRSVNKIILPKAAACSVTCTVVQESK